MGVCGPYLTLMTEEAPQREYPLRAVFNGLRYIVRDGIAWRIMPNDLPPWYTVYQQTQRGLKAGCLRRWPMTCGHCCAGAGPEEQASAAILDSHTYRAGDPRQ